MRFSIDEVFNPVSDDIKRSEKHSEYLSEYYSEFRELTKKLNAEQQVAINSLKDLSSCMLREAQFECFKEGFKTGLCLVLEALSY